MEVNDQVYGPDKLIRGVEPPIPTGYYEGRTEIHKQLFFACELGKADEGECRGRWNQLLCYP